MTHPITKKDGSDRQHDRELVSRSAERILLCAHYDTRPLPDNDTPRLRKEGIFLGTNNGASGVAVLMELAHHVKSLPDRYGLDFRVFSTRKSLVYGRHGQYFLGSEYFAEDYSKKKRNYEYVAGVLLDMVGDSKLSIYQEGHSVTWTNTRPIVQGPVGDRCSAGNRGVRASSRRIRAGRSSPVESHWRHSRWSTSSISSTPIARTVIGIQPTTPPVAARPIPWAKWGPCWSNGSVRRSKRASRGVHASGLAPWCPFGGSMTACSPIHCD